MKCRPSAIIIQNDQLLTMRYVYGDREVFALPGGNPDPAECLTTALARELYEELGVRIKVDALVVCGEVLWTDIQRDTLHMVYQTTITEGTPLLNPHETTALNIAWLPLTTLHEVLLYPNIGTPIQNLAVGSPSEVYIGQIDQPFIS
jgi:8-oxo-dGTP diphosphatase